jgi:hypothetical protein
MLVVVMPQGSLSGNPGLQYVSPSEKIKYLGYKMEEHDEEIKTLNKELKTFEHKYKKDSSEFIKEFKEGVASDDMDFIEWSSLYQMRNGLLDKRLP